MKKYIGLLCFLMMGAVAAHAQSLSGPLNYKRTAVFSPALFDSNLWNTKKTSSGQVKSARNNAGRRTTVLRYEKGVEALTEEQKKQLMPVLQRIEQRAVSRIQLVAASLDVDHTTDRMRYISDFLNANNHTGRSVKFYLKVVPVNAIIASTNDTVKVIELN